MRTKRAKILIAATAVLLTGGFMPENASGSMMDAQRASLLDLRDPVSDLTIWFMKCFRMEKGGKLLPCGYMSGRIGMNLEKIREEDAALPAEEGTGNGRLLKYQKTASPLMARADEKDMEKETAAPQIPDEPAPEASGRAPAPENAEEAHVHVFLPVYETVTLPEKSHVVHHEAQYSTVHHDAVTHTVHHEAVYGTVWHDAVTHQEPVYEWHTFCNHCGMESPSFEHMLEYDCGYYSSQVQVGEMMVTDQPGWEEQVMTSPAWDEVVVDQAAWEEQVMVSPAWDETVLDQAAQEVQEIVCYRCSCGAVQ